MPPQFMSTSQTPSFKFSKQWQIWAFENSHCNNVQRWSECLVYVILILCPNICEWFARTSHRTVMFSSPPTTLWHPHIEKTPGKPACLFFYSIKNPLPDWAELLCQNWVPTLMQSSTWSHYWNSAWEETKDWNLKQVCIGMHTGMRLDWPFQSDKTHPEKHELCIIAAVLHCKVPLFARNFNYTNTERKVCQGSWQQVQCSSSTVSSHSCWPELGRFGPFFQAVHPWMHPPHLPKNTAHATDP